MRGNKHPAPARRHPQSCGDMSLHRYGRGEHGDIWFYGAQELVRTSAGKNGRVITMLPNSCPQESGPAFLAWQRQGLARG